MSVLLTFRALLSHGPKSNPAIELDQLRNVHQCVMHRFAHVYSWEFGKDERVKMFAKFRELVNHDLAL